MNDKEILLEQYKLYVEMTDRISNRRTQTNRFYITLLTGLLAILSIASNNSFLNPYFKHIILFVSILGILLNIVWIININSFRQLNTGKFKVIHQLEENLPFAPYSIEWNILGAGKNKMLYYQITRVEKYVPIILSIPYLLMFVITIC